MQTFRTFLIAVLARAVTGACLLILLLNVVQFGVLTKKCVLAGAACLQLRVRESTATATAGARAGVESLCVRRSACATPLKERLRTAQRGNTAFPPSGVLRCARPAGYVTG